MVLVTRKYLAMRKGDVYYEYRCIEETHSKIFWEAWGRNHVQSFCAGRQFQCLWELSFTEKINGVGIKLLMTKGLWNKSLKREGYRISNGWYGNPFFMLCLFAPGISEIVLFLSIDSSFWIYKTHKFSGIF